MNTISFNSLRSLINNVFDNETLSNEIAVDVFAMNAIDELDLAHSPSINIFFDNDIVNPYLESVGHSYPHRQVFREHGFMFNFITGSWKKQFATLNAEVRYRLQTLYASIRLCVPESMRPTGPMTIHDDLDGLYIRGNCKNLEAKLLELGFWLDLNQNSEIVWRFQHPNQDLMYVWDMLLRYHIGQAALL